MRAKTKGNTKRGGKGKEKLRGVIWTERQSRGACREEQQRGETERKKRGRSSIISRAFFIFASLCFSDGTLTED